MCEFFLCLGSLSSTFFCLCTNPCSVYGLHLPKTRVKDIAQSTLPVEKNQLVLFCHGRRESLEVSFEGH
jgi:hypothetical protein